MFENLKNMGEYYFIYDTTGENKKKEGDIVFEIYNNKSKIRMEHQGWEKLL